VELIMEETKILEGEEAQQAIEQAAQNRAEDPFEVAAMVHTMYLTPFLTGIDSISGGACRRILKFLVSYPLLQDDVNDAHPDVRHLAYLGDRLCESKFLMIMNEFNNQREKIMQNLNDLNEGENNGEKE
jgi:hypothetical protein